MTERKGYLRLRPSTVTIDDKSNPTFIGRRQTERKFSATTLIDVSKMGKNSQAGLTAYAERRNHYDVVIDSDAKGEKHIQAVIRIGQSRNVMASVPLKQEKDLPADRLGRSFLQSLLLC